MKKVLIGYMTDGRTSGIDKYLLNVLNIILKNGCQAECLTSQPDEELGKRLEAMGVVMHTIPSLKHPYGQYKAVRRIIRAGQYDVAYFNISEAFNCCGLLAARRERVSRIIVHSHSSGVDSESSIKRGIRTILNRIARSIVMNKKKTCYYACSNKAAQWLFAGRVIKSGRYGIINNAVDVSRFRYDSNIRTAKRKELAINDRLVIGHVGGFNYQKNHEFLIEIMEQLVKLNSNVVLLLAGTGENYSGIQELVHEKGLDAYVRFLGVRSDVNELMQAMDIFVLPSRFEGLPIVAVEAQVSGLKVVLSDSISDETALSDRCIFESLGVSPTDWARLINDNLVYDRENIKLSDSYCFSIADQTRQILDMLGVECEDEPFS